MDPLLFGVNLDVVGEALGLIVVLSLLTERFLAPWFEWRHFIDNAKDKGLKEPVAFIMAFIVVISIDFDALAVIAGDAANSWMGCTLTAGAIAGGSKGSIKLFRDFLGWQSEAQAQKTAEAQTVGNQ